MRIGCVLSSQPFTSESGPSWLFNTRFLQRASTAMRIGVLRTQHGCQGHLTRCVIESRAVSFLTSSRLRMSSPRPNAFKGSGVSTASPSNTGTTDRATSGTSRIQIRTVPVVQYICVLSLLAADRPPTYQLPRHRCDLVPTLFASIPRTTTTRKWNLGLEGSD